MRFYIDTCIWIDMCEDRKGFLGEPLDEYASRLFWYILENQHQIIITDFLIEELEKSYSLEQINGMMMPYIQTIKTVVANKRQIKEAKFYVKTRQIPGGDALGAIIARDQRAVLVSRDNHFRKLRDICTFKKPEEIV